MIARLILSFWDVCLDNLPQGSFERSRATVAEASDLAELDPATFGNAKLPIKSFTPEETREIVFKTLLNSEVDHTIQLDSNGAADYRSVVGFFARQLLKELCLVGGYDQLYPKVKAFMCDICSPARSIWTIR